MHCVTHKENFSGTCICTVVQPLVWVRSPGAGLQATTMPVEIVQIWNDETPPGKVLVADSFFGSHDAAAMLSARRRPFLMLLSTRALVQDGNVGLEPGSAHTVVENEHRYALTLGTQDTKSGAQAGKGGTTANQLLDWGSASTPKWTIPPTGDHCQLS